MEIKITKKMRFTEIREIMEELGKTELVEFIDHEIELIDRKAENRKMGTSKKAVENDNITNLIIEALTSLNKPVTITELLKIDTLANYVTEDGKSLSNQKISALLKPLLKSSLNPSGIVTRTMDKKIVLFSIEK